MERSEDIVNELKEISPLLAGLGRENIFTVPEGYFETATEALMAVVKGSASTCNDIPGEYFDTLSNIILSKIDGTVAHELQQLSPFMAGLKKVSLYDVPQHYFEDNLSAAAALTGTDHSSEVLKNISKAPVFEVPEGYFDRLADDTLNKAKGVNSARIIKTNFRSAVLKYAAAAVFTGMIALGVYKYNSPAAPVIESLPVAMNEDEFNQKIENLSEEDIIKYLEKNGSETDVAALSSGIEETSLPEQEDYFTDENTLDKFLENIDLKN